MKKTYQTPELEHIALELDEPVTVELFPLSNIFGVAAENEAPEVTEL